MQVDEDLKRFCVQTRQHLHKHPEVSKDERNTAEFVANFLRGLNPDAIHEGIGGWGYGVVAVFGPKIEETRQCKAPRRDGGRCLLFRAELDALPIQEVNEFEHKSCQDGVSHKCGHDGHMATLLGFARMVEVSRPKRGQVVLLFQPAEETGTGACAMLADPVFRKGGIKPDCVFAFHNLPGYKRGEIVLRKQSFTASVRSLAVTFFGKTSHAAEPEKGLNPAFLIARIVLEASKLANNEPQRQDFRVLTPVDIVVGERTRVPAPVGYGISAGYGELHLTIRTWTETEMLRFVDELLSLIASITGTCPGQPEVSTEDRLSYTVDWTESFAANENTDYAVDVVERAARQGGFDLHFSTQPMKWGEDFGQFTQKFDGAFFAIGSGEEHPALHNPDYDYPDDITEVGLRMFAAIATDPAFGLY
eukprot:TRINITY_DN34284_c0_g1_i1.p1 TRINITY_DN34284_c0_g1~~TRINITY_DN34284_c0_g1_i1.p1  ORF type:complete len:419 (+),score=87.07 TRINITY_DN34284_c0_g1_i1:168-1424(+)